MAPKLAMKAMKAMKVKKSMKTKLTHTESESSKKSQKPLGKGKGPPLEKGAGRPLEKGQAKAKTLAAKKRAKNALNQANLEKLGAMTLDDKVKAATEQGQDLEEAAQILKDSLTKGEHSKLWGKHSTYLANNPLEKGKMENLSKKEKGLKAAQWLLETSGKKYLHVAQGVKATESMARRNRWESEKQMLDRFSWEEFEAHISSGRVQYRQDPYTPGVWQYKDTQDWDGQVHVARSSKWQQGHEKEPGEEDSEWFRQLHQQEALGLGAEDIAGKGFGKGQSFGKGSGKGKKGKGKGKKGLLALEDGNPNDEEEPTEEDEIKQALKKARRARDNLAKAQSDLEEALGKASSKLSSKGKVAAQGWNASLSKVLVQMKALLGGKKQLSIAEMKKLLEEAARVVKGAKDEAKELRALAGRASSVASKGSKGSK